MDNKEYVAEFLECAKRQKDFPALQNEPFFEKGLTSFIKGIFEYLSCEEKDVMKVLKKRASIMYGGETVWHIVLSLITDGNYQIDKESGFSRLDQMIFSKSDDDAMKTNSYYCIYMICPSETKHKVSRFAYIVANELILAKTEDVCRKEALIC